MEITLPLYRNKDLCIGLCLTNNICARLFVVRGILRRSSRPDDAKLVLQPTLNYQLWCPVAFTMHFIWNDQCIYHLIVTENNTIHCPFGAVWCFMCCDVCCDVLFDVLCCDMWCDVWYVIWSVMWCDVICDVMYGVSCDLWCDVIYDVMCDVVWNMVWYDMLWCDVICEVVWIVVWCDVMWWDVIWMYCP